ncbi:MAG: molybdopterin dehydrogenase, FAD-binding [Bryobacterales bacterium]|jgi:xanthine dehydrogenase small subunit|nr:molybdopterin dehydrogenase, FAD-binding [Bryobacterales bacterium]
MKRSCYIGVENRFSEEGKTSEFLLNGRRTSIDGAAVQTTLLDYLRDQGLTGAKEGCAEGECGACTVVMLMDDAGGSAYRAVNSCLMFAPMAAGREIYTVEALAQNGELADVQKAMAAAGGSQCGYCTPGFVMSMFAEQYRRDREGPCDPHELSGNLCRCTGYRPIRDAALSLGPAPAGEFLDRLSQPAQRLESVDHQTTTSRFSRPTTLEQCFTILAADPEARLVAGGTDVGVESNLKGTRWNHIISLEAIGELREFSETEERVLIGAGLTLNEIPARWTAAPEAFREWLVLFGSPPIRNRATLGGNLATASAIGDGAPLLLALDASVHLVSKGGKRVVPLQSFFTGYRRTALVPRELIAAIEIPKPLPTFVKFYKVAKRRMDDISTVAACMTMDWDESGRVDRCRFAFNGVAAVPLRAAAAEDAVVGQRWNEAAVERAQAALDRTLRPISDHRGSAEYRLAVAKSLVGKFLWNRRETAA